MRFHLLGRVAVGTDGGHFALPKGRKQRLLLAALLLHAPRVASSDRLCDILWGGSQPDDPAAALRTQISRCRAFLREAGADPETLRSEPYGYRMAIEPIAVDAGRLELLLRRAADLAPGREKAELLDEALGLWGGDPYEEFADLTPFLGEVTRLREIRAGAREARVECLLAENRLSEALAAAEELVREDPLRERPRALLMQALYQAGRQHEALACFQEYRRQLADELGLDPSPALRQLESEILRHEHVPLSPRAVIALRTHSTDVVETAPDADHPAATAATEPAGGAVPAVPYPPPPVPLTRLIGREAEMNTVRRLLDSGRLLTLTGAGGSGKTRLALEIAAQVRGTAGRGVAWVGLEGLADPELLAQDVAAALGISEHPELAAEANLLRVLGSQELLLCLDNCEHLIDGCARLVEALLLACPAVSILTTSREPLGVRGELTWPVPPLPVPPADLDDPEALQQFAAVRLFVERASEADPSLRLTRENAGAVAQICCRLDGIPLALELAAARVRAMSVAQLADRLDRRFHLLTAGSRTALPRHQTLRAAIDWSYRLLPEPERQLLDRLSVFAGGFTLEAVESVCSDAETEDSGSVLEAFTALVDKSLVVALGPGGSDQYRLLETIRAFARERLQERGEDDDLRQRHAAYFTALAEAAEPHLLGGRRREWVDRLSGEQDNLRAALHRTRADPRTASLHVRLAASLWWIWHAEGQVTEARAWIEQALLLPEASAPGPIRAKLLYGGAMASWLGGDHERAKVRAEEGLELARALGNDRALTRALSVHAWLLRDYGETEAAARFADECVDIARRGNVTPTELAFGLWLQGSVHFTAGDFDVARAAQEEAATIWRSEGTRWGLSQVLHGLAIIALVRGELDEAGRLCREAVAELRRERDAYWICRTLEGLAAVLARQGSFDRAARLLGAAEALREPIGTPLLAFETPRYEQTVALLRERMSAADFAAAWADGRAWSLEQALAYALAEESTHGAHRSGSAVLSSLSAPRNAPITTSNLAS
jgi:predicted ATPase/DNA-binding SARP family transcriptional activator